MRGFAASADAERFTGRAVELDAARDLLDESTASRVLYLHGPGGIGKSAVIRVIERLAANVGFESVRLHTAGGSRAFASRAAEASHSHDSASLVIVDEADRLGSELTTWRDRLVDQLASTDRLVFAGRNAPDPTWRLDGLDAIVTDIEMQPLSPEESLRLLAALGVDTNLQGDIADWAQGSPLALTVAALSPGAPLNRPVMAALEARLTTWLTGANSLDIGSDVLDVAALAPVVDARIIAAALPARPTRDAMPRLLALPVVDRVGDRAVLHRVLAEAVRRRLQHEAPERYRTLSRRIVEHLGARSRLGDMTALIELSQFVTDPVLRQSIANTPSATQFTDAPHDGELGAFLREQGFDDNGDLDELTSWEDHGAQHRLVVRRLDRSIVMYASFARADQIPTLGPITESLATEATRSGADPSRTFVGVVYFAEATYDERSEAARLGSGALMHLHGVPDMQAVLIHYPEPDRRPLESLSAIAQPLESPVPREVALSDFRPFGVVGFVESIVLSDLGFAPRAADHEALLIQNADPEREARLRARLDDVFDDSDRDRRLRRVIELVHFEPRRPQQECLEVLHVSRRTWFRLLREARERVLDTSGD